MESTTAPETASTKPLYRIVPALTEPPVGTVAEFGYSFKCGGGSCTNLLIRTADGWSRSVGGVEPRSWQELTDLFFMNAEIQRRHAGSTAKYIAVEILTVSGPCRLAHEADPNESRNHDNPQP